MHVDPAAASLPGLNVPTALHFCSARASFARLDTRIVNLVGYSTVFPTLRIDLLVTDVGLPGGMNGRQMADAARVFRPDLKVLFITGYAENVFLGNGHLASGMAVMTKPFPIEIMAARMRSMIEGGKEHARRS